MPQFLIDHLEGCTPANQCASCRGMAFLKVNLAPAKYQEFVQILEETTGISISGTISLSTPWDKVLKKQTYRTRHCLKNDGIVTLADLLRRTKVETLRMPNFGKKSLGELEQELAEHGLYFGMDVPDDPKPEPPPSRAPV